MKKEDLTIDLKSVFNDLARQEDCTTEYLSEALDLYQKFLLLKKKYPDEKLVPPKAADDMWHQHILDTRKYMQDCQDFFGRYIHHNPHFFGTPDYDESWEETRKLYKQEFNTILPEQKDSLQSDKDYNDCCGCA